MLKKFMMSLATLLACTTSAFAALPAQMPDQFTVTEHFLSWTSTFDIESSHFKLGKVHRKLLSLKLEYDFYDNDEMLQAKARMRWLSWGATFDITDGLDVPMGRVEQRIFTFFPTFDIISPAEQKQATVKLNFWSTKYTLRDPVTEREMATISRPFFSFFYDCWTVNILDHHLMAEKNINPALFILIAAFQTDRDNWRRQQQVQDELDRQNKKKNGYYAGSIVTADSQSDESIELLKQQLAAFQGNFEDVEVTHTDIEKVDSLVQNFPFNEESLAELSENERIVEGMNQLVPLLNDDQLSHSEKGALFYLMHSKIQEMK